MPALLSTGPIEKEKADLPYAGHLFPGGGGSPLVGADSTSSWTSDISQQATALRQAVAIVEALARQWSDEAYLARVKQWADELRREMEHNHRLLHRPADDVYDAAYAELLDLERRIL